MHRRCWQRRWCQGPRRGCKGLGMGLLGGNGAISPLKHRSELIERGRWPHHGNKRGLLVKSVAEADEEDLDELLVVDGVLKLTELVSDGMKVLTINANGGVSLNGA